MESMAKGKIRVYQLARELGITSKEALAKLRDLGIELSNHWSSVTQEEAQQLEDALKAKAEPPKREVPPSRKEEKPVRKKAPVKRKAKVEKGRVDEAQVPVQEKAEVEERPTEPELLPEEREEKEEAPAKRREAPSRDLSSPFIYRPRTRPKRKKRRKREEEFLEEQEVLPGRVDMEEGVAYLLDALSVRELAALFQEEVDRVVGILLKKG
ncbi:MAG: hypothetical protein DRI93_06780, partial [Aquificota bacterium]